MDDAKKVVHKPAYKQVGIYYSLLPIIEFQLSQ